MSAIDYAIVAAYLIGLLVVGFLRRSRSDETAAGFIIGSRTLTLPAFVASLVSTWYGGILGVGEFSFKHGVSMWFVFGLPYYLAALIFALFLANRARKSEHLTIPDRLEKTYGRTTAGFAAVILFVTTVPAANVLMIGSLMRLLFGWPLWVGAILGTLFSVVYVHYGGFKSVVRTDILQFCMMYAGFILLFVASVVKLGGFDFLTASVPEEHFTWRGGNSGWYIAVWYVIALQTLIEPAFYQRCYAVKNARDARKGIFLSIALWFVFDFLTLSCGLFAKAQLQTLSDPIASYPALALEILPIGLLGFFMTSLIAAVMSNVDSYLFIAASTFGRDFMWRYFGASEDRVAHWTRVGLVVATSLALAMALFFESVVDIWHHFGSISTPALLVPLFTSYVGRWRMTSGWAAACSIISALVSLIWLISGMLSIDGSYWLGTEPVFPGVVVSLVIFAVARKQCP